MKKNIKLRSIRSAWVCLVLVLWSGCLFFPSKVENPIQSITRDPLNFKQILAKNTEKFTAVDYDELLDDQCVYVNAQNPSDVWQRHYLLNRLLTLKSLVDSTEWLSENGAFVEKLNENGVNTLASRKYRVKAKNSTKLDTGEVIFDVVMNNKREWVIQRFKDNPGSEKSIFHP